MISEASSAQAAVAHRKTAAASTVRMPPRMVASFIPDLYPALHAGASARIEKRRRFVRRETFALAEVSDGSAHCRKPATSPIRPQARGSPLCPGRIAGAGCYSISGSLYDLGLIGGGDDAHAPWLDARPGAGRRQRLRSRRPAAGERHPEFERDQRRYRGGVNDPVGHPRRPRSEYAHTDPAPLSDQLSDAL